MNTVKRLWIFFAAGIAIAVLLICIFLSDDGGAGSLSSNAAATYIFEYACIAFTLGCIYLSLKLFKIRSVEYDINSSEKAYLKWSIIRMSMLFVPLYADLACYFLTLDPVGNFAAAITALALLFTLPKDRNQKDASEK